MEICLQKYGSLRVFATYAKVAHGLSQMLI